MSKFRHIAFTLFIAGGLSLGVMPVSSAMAQDEGGSGLFGGLFNPGAGTSGAKPLFVKPNVKAPTGLATTGTASATGVARAPTSSYKSNAADLMGYRDVTPQTDDANLSLGEVIQMETEKQMATSKAYRDQKNKEAAELAEVYRQQMEAKLAAQENPSASQSMGGGGTMGMNEEQVRKMVYKKKDNSPTGTGAKPIRLFQVQ